MLLCYCSLYAGSFARKVRSAFESDKAFLRTAVRQHSKLNLRGTSLPQQHWWCAALHVRACLYMRGCIDLSGNTIDERAMAGLIPNG